MDHWRLQHRFRGALLGVAVGNGGAMRMAPVALIPFSNLPRVAALAPPIDRITRAHTHGKEETVLQACAIAWLLYQPPQTLAHGTSPDMFRAYARVPRYLEKIEQFLMLWPAADGQAVVEQIGDGIATCEVVPAALYCLVGRPQSAGPDA